MGTRFRTLLAPINASTGDGRRFAEGGVTLAPLPMPFEWVRQRGDGHNGAVSVGAVHEANIGTVGQAIESGWIAADRVAGMDVGDMGVWASGEFHDDIDRRVMPRLAEDVAEAMHLISNGTLGPSVDPDEFEGVPVYAGTNNRATPEGIAAHFALNGEDPKLELLVTSGRIRAATLVSIPAFVETPRPLELILETEPQDEAASQAHAAALIASVAAPARTRILAETFDGKHLDRPTPITYDFDSGRVYGHAAVWGTCHVGYSGVCITPPEMTDGGAAFNRFPVETEDGVIWAGRITAGGAHAPLSMTAGAAMNAYDGKAVVAYVRAYPDQFGIALAGVLAEGISEGDKAIMSRRKVSGDWRETANGLSLVEVLALPPGMGALSEPGFPVETFSRSGRQVALVASLSPEPEVSPEVTEVLVEAVDVGALVREEIARIGAREELDRVLREDARSSLAAILLEA